MRLRLPELLEQRGVTAHQLALASGGRISRTVLYRLVARRGKADHLPTKLLDELCRAFNVGPGDLLECEPRKRRTPKARTTRRTR